MQDAATAFRGVFLWQGALVIALGAYVISPMGLGFWHWNLQAGLVVALAWLLPWRQVPWLMLFTGFVSASTRPVVSLITDDASLVPTDGFLWWGSAWHPLIGSFADPLLALLPVWLLRRRLGRVEDVASLSGIAWLHALALMTAVLMTATDVLWVLSEGFVADVRRGAVVNAVTITPENAWLLIGTFALKNLLGYFLGIMLVAPLLAWLAEPALRRGSAPIIREALLFLLPAAALFIMIVLAVPGTKMAELLRLMLLAAVVVFAMRKGWRGAVLSVLVVSVALGIEDHLGRSPQSPVWLQTFVAIAGAMALLFGATVDSLHAQALDLERSRVGEQQAREALAEAAGRVVRAQEEDRRRIAADLHDEVGQNLTALHTRIKLVEPELSTLPQRAFLEELRQLGGDMRRALRDVLEAIHPAALSELGLVRALEDGALRNLAQMTGVRFELKAYGAPSLYAALDDALRVSAYRIVQEAVNNALRHADARRVLVRLRVGWRHGEVLLALRVTDDGRGLRDDALPGNGRRGMRDRALMLGGDLKVMRHPRSGTVVKALLRQRGA